MRTFTISTKIDRPLADVFNAVFSKDHLSKYFCDRASMDLLEGERVVWNWGDFPDHPVQVTKVVENKLIEFVLSSLDWQKSDGEDYAVTVTMEFESLTDTQTLLVISETGWIDSEDGIKGSYDNCQGWTHMAMCLKAYIEHGIDLRWKLTDC